MLHKRPYRKNEKHHCFGTHYLDWGSDVLSGLTKTSTKPSNRSHSGCQSGKAMSLLWHRSDATSNAALPSDKFGNDPISLKYTIPRFTHEEEALCSSFLHAVNIDRQRAITANLRNTPYSLSGHVGQADRNHNTTISKHPQTPAIPLCSSRLSRRPCLRLPACASGRRGPWR